MAQAKKEKTLAQLKRAVAESLAVDRHRLLMKMPFIGAFIMRLNLIPVRDARLTTAAANGDSIFLDIDFYAKLTEEERLFVLAHEAWHCALLHFARRQGRNAERFNYAADLEIHFLLTSNGLKTPFVLQHDPAWKGLSAEEIYARYDVPAEDNGCESENIKNKRSGGGFDMHLEKQPLLHGKQPQKTGSNKAPEDFMNEAQGAFDGDFEPGIPNGALERCRERLTAAHQQCQRQGKVPLGLENVIEAILEPEINWRELLRQFVTSSYGGSRQWLPPNRRHIWQGLYLQSSRQERLRALVALDTSGSTQGDLPLFLSEFAGLLLSFGSYELTLIQCDAAIQSVQFFDDTHPLPPRPNLKMLGGGGTDFRPVFRYIEAHSELDPQLLVYFTDGWGDFPQRAPSYPVLWMLMEGCNTSIPWGDQAFFKNPPEDSIE